MSEGSTSSPSIGSTLRAAALGTGMVASASLWSEVVPILGENDLSTPAGRFRALTSALPQFAPLVGSATLLFLGSRGRSSLGRGLIAVYFLAVVSVALLGVLRVLPDAQAVVPDIRAADIVQFRVIVLRTLLDLLALAGLLGYGALL